jgi:hypothetical protein
MIVRYNNTNTAAFVVTAAGVQCPQDAAPRGDQAP